MIFLQIFGKTIFRLSHFTVRCSSVQKIKANKTAQTFPYGKGAFSLSFSQFVEQVEINTYITIIFPDQKLIKEQHVDNSNVFSVYHHDISCQ